MDCPGSVGLLLSCLNSVRCGQECCGKYWEENSGASGTNAPTILHLSRRTYPLYAVSPQVKGLQA